MAAVVAAVVDGEYLDFFCADDAFEDLLGGFRHFSFFLMEMINKPIKVTTHRQIVKKQMKMLTRGKNWGDWGDKESGIF